MIDKKNSFEYLSSINVNDRVKEKIGLKYLSWADAWNLLKINYPDATSTIYTRKTHITKTIVTTDTDSNSTTTVVYDEGEQEVPYFTDGVTCFVKVGVTVNGVEYVEMYPVMDLKNNAVKLRSVTMTDVNKALQRGFVKAVARHGLGLYIYTGEDLPNPIDEDVELSGKDDFASVQADVIKLVQTLCGNKNKIGEVTRYVKEVFGETKLSQTTEDHLTQLKQAREYLSTL